MVRFALSFLFACFLFALVSDMAFAQRGRYRCFAQKDVHFVDRSKVTWLENILETKQLHEGWNKIADISNCDVLHAYVQEGRIIRWVMVDGYGGLSYNTYLRDSTKAGYKRLVWERWKGSSRFIEAPESVLLQ